MEIKENTAHKNINKIAALGMLSALAVIFGYVEYLIPFSAAVPGIKLGLCNIVIMYVMYVYSWREALTVSAVRILIIGALFGSMISVIYAVAGALLSILCMALARSSRKFSIIGISALGGAAHNAGQLAAAYFLVGGIPMSFYLPVLIWTGLVTGIIIGALTRVIILRVKKS